MSRSVSSGFTLFEILVVLVLLALVTGATLTQLDKMYQSYELGTQRDDVVRTLSQLGLHALQKGRPFTLEGEYTEENKDLALPQGWSVVVEEPIEYTFRGICRGGELTLVYGEREYKYVLYPPLCRLLPTE